MGQLRDRMEQDLILKGFAPCPFGGGQVATK